MRRTRTVFTDAWEAAAAGAPAAELPAYRFQPPVADLLAGFASQMAHWPWVDPPASSAPSPIPIDLPQETSLSLSLAPAPDVTAPDVPPLDVPSPDVTAPAALPSPGSRPTDVVADRPPAVPDLVVLSHLRWTFVWQRPQHLVSRFARRRAEQAARTFFVEEPMPGPVAAPEVRSEGRDGVTRIWLVVPGPDPEPRGPESDRRLEFDRRLGFDDPAARAYPGLLADFLAARGVEAAADVLLYTPMAIEVAEALEPARLAYDVMDDLASFKDAPEGMVLRQRRLLAEADVVFAGGRSLHRSAAAHRKGGAVHLFPSGVDVAHYASAVGLRASRPRPAAGYVGVIDERLDLELLAGLAAALPDWDLQIVGPVAKVDPEDLPQAPNLHYPGKADYANLPRVMAGFDVALMPFALNEATRSISPTKTLEYLAAGLPVVSTRVPDVVADYTGTVHLADDVGGFAAGCRQVLHDSLAEREQRIRHIKERQEWDTIAAAMADLLRPDAGHQDEDAEATA